MKRFLKKTFIYVVIISFLGEFFSRIIVDPFVFYSLNSYDLKYEKRNIRDYIDFYSKKHTKNTDFIFIGSSRVPASINSILFSKLSGNKKVINAGRGYSTFGIHYQALKNKIKNYPNFLKNSFVFVEYPGPIYTSNFKDNEMLVFEPKISAPGSDKPMPQLMLPHLSFNSLLEFFIKSKNSFFTKVQMGLLQSSFYRSAIFINEKYKHTSNKLIFTNEEKIKPILAEEGGIINDNFEIAREKAKVYSEFEINKIKKDPQLSYEILNQSSFFMLNKIIKENGGSLILFKMPLHSIQANVNNFHKSISNKKVFEDWVKSLNIPIIMNYEFQYSDEDFPDFWHLSSKRRNEFTELLYLDLIDNYIKKP